MSAPAALATLPTLCCPGSSLTQTTAVSSCHGIDDWLGTTVRAAPQPRVRYPSGRISVRPGVTAITFLVAWAPALNARFPGLQSARPNWNVSDVATLVRI